MVKRMTGNWVIDPSMISITGLYNAAANDLTWNRRVLDMAGIEETKLPPLIRGNAVYHGQHLREVGGVSKTGAARGHHRRRRQDPRSHGSEAALDGRFRVRVSGPVLTAGSGHAGPRPPAGRLESGPATKRTETRPPGLRRPRNIASPAKHRAQGQSFTVNQYC
jgi:hypothetical protein